MNAMLLMVLLLPMGMQGDPEAQYRADYAQYDDLTKLADPAERAAKFMDFVETGFDDRLLGGVAAGIQDSLNALTETDALYPLADRWDAQTGEMSGAAISLQSAATSGNDEMIVKYGEIIYTVNPVVDIAQILAASYSALGNYDKFEEYATILIGEQGISDSFNLAFNIYQHELGEENWDTAAEWAGRFKGLGAAPAGVSAAEWRTMGVEFQVTLARAEFEGGRHAAAIREYQALAAMGRDQRGIANFRMGQSHYALGQLPQALNRFADAAVINDATYSGPAMTMVEEIYTTNTGGTMEGINENVLNAARARMR